MVSIVEGKKRFVFYQDCRGVSEIYGQLLMMSIVVLAFSTIGLAVFSDGGVVKPEHIPNTDLQENFNRSTNTLQIIHRGGEAIDESAIKIIVNVNGEKRGEFDSNSDDFTVKNPNGTVSSDDVFTLGDCIEINTESMELKAGEDIDIFFIDKPSDQVIQRAVLQRGSWKVPEWITPHPYGSVYSNSTENGGWQPTEMVDAISDGINTKDSVPKDQLVYQEFQFGIDTDEMEISDPLSQVQLKIIYESHDCNPNEFPLSIYNGSDWVRIDYTMKENYNFAQCEADGETVFDINLAPYYVNTTEKLEKLVVRFSATGNTVTGNASTDKYYCVDFIGINVDF